jgi:SP family general alpha glucoside:H+ symporter-like MFS transporter
MSKQHDVMDEKSFGHEVRQVEDMDKDDWNHVREEAIAAEEAEHHLSLREAFKLYPTAIFWSFSISLVIIMEVGRAAQ